MSSLVVDASVAVKWFVPEVRSAAAAEWLTRGHELLAPDLIFSEIGNIIWKKIVRSEITDDEGRMILRAFDSVALEVHATRELLALAFEIAFGLRRTVYDSTYLALAVARSCEAVTADRKLYDSVAASVLGSHIRWIEDLD